jgi:hypothetical protein
VEEVTEGVETAEPGEERSDLSRIMTMVAARRNAVELAVLFIGRQEARQGSGCGTVDHSS